MKYDISSAKYNKSRIITAAIKTGLTFLFHLYHEVPPQNQVFVLLRLRAFCEYDIIRDIYK